MRESPLDNLTADSLYARVIHKGVFSTGYLQVDLWYKDQNSPFDNTAIPYRVSTGPEQGFPFVLFPNREIPVFITGIPANGNRFFPVRKSTQGKPCFHYRDGFAVY